MELRPATEIIQVAAAVLRRLNESPFWTQALGETSQEAIPRLVQRLDHEDAFYYLVTVNKTQGATARLAIDGRTGSLLEVEGVEEAGASLPAFVDPIVVLRQRAQRHSS